jgi:hypothetical protein
MLFTRLLVSQWQLKNAQAGSIFSRHKETRVIVKIEPLKVSLNAIFSGTNQAKVAKWSMNKRRCSYD